MDDKKNISGIFDPSQVFSEDNIEDEIDIIEQSDIDEEHKKIFINILNFTKTSINKNLMIKPEELELLNNFIENGAQRMFDLLKSEIEHNQECEKKELEIEETIVKSNFKSYNRGQIFAFILGISGLISSTILLLLNHNISGLAIFGSGFLVFAGSFLYNRIRQSSSSDNREEKP